MTKFDPENILVSVQFFKRYLFISILSLKNDNARKTTAWQDFTEMEQLSRKQKTECAKTKHKRTH